MFYKLISHKIPLVLVLTITVLSGCVAIKGMFGSVVQAYKGPQKEDAELALIKDAIRKDYGYAVLAKVDDIPYGDDAFLGWPSKVHVLPGTHKITVRCLAGDVYKFPYVTKTFEAGRRYDVLCKQEGYNDVSAVVLYSID